MQETGSTTRMSGRHERLALVMVLLIVVGIPMTALGYQFGLRPALAKDVQEVDIVGRLPEHGGWSPETVRVEVGKPVRLRLSSDDVVHGFAIGKLGVDAGWVYPGQSRVVEFTPQRAGRYTFYCTTWCADGHWRMRGTLEVYDPDDPSAVDVPVDPPQTDWPAEGVDIDAPHLAAQFPATRPSAARGAAIWQGTPGLPDASLVLAWLDLRRQSPAQVFETLREDRIPGLKIPPYVIPSESASEESLWLNSGQDSLARLSELPPAALWDVVAYLWREGTSAESIALGERLYLTNCVACHGETGDGKGPAAATLTAPHTEHELPRGHGPQSPANFTDARATAGGSGMVYYGKLVRGGMGTGMPYWGSIFTERELWALVDYVWTFLFDLSEEGNEVTR